MLDQTEIRRRIRAAMALSDISSWDDLAERTPYSRTLLKDLGTSRGRAQESHLRVIAAACKLPYAWFTVPDLGAAVASVEEDASLSERVEALERRHRAEMGEVREQLSDLLSRLPRPGGD